MIPVPHLIDQKASEEEHASDGRRRGVYEQDYVEQDDLRKEVGHMERGWVLKGIDEMPFAFPFFLCESGTNKTPQECKGQRRHS
mmetsp:Transcript_12966/g.31588  ORF Transcript_12966/g.31588 Transcript_12966/m.31588 type:complete len:84 (+) Transcript_12966:522-773(+)